MLKARIASASIPDIYITRIHNPGDPDCDVHCESFSRLAEVRGEVEVLTPYFASSGTGQIKAVFPLPV